MSDFFKLPQPDGSLLIMPGSPETVPAEVNVRYFSKRTGISQRRVIELCVQNAITHRRKSSKQRSSILIPRSEITRFKKLKGK